MKAIAYYKLERRTTVKTVEQLQGSKTIVSALTTQYQLRAFNILAAVLIILWALSPLGSQASLRVGDFQVVTSVSQYDYTYLDVRTEFSPFDSGYALDPANALFISSLITPKNMRNSPQDSWGNVRVPMIETLADTDASSDEWIPFIHSNDSQYAALVGIPVTGPALDNKSTTRFTISTSYWVLKCDTKFFPMDLAAFYVNNARYWDKDFLNNTDNAFTYMGWNETDYRNLGISFDNITQLPNITLNSVDLKQNLANRPRQALIQTLSHAEEEYFSNEVFKALCDLTTTYVDVNISCNGQSCQAMAVNRIGTSDRGRYISVLDAIGLGRASTWLENFLNASKSGRDGISMGISPTFGYIANPKSPFSYSNLAPNWREVKADDFSQRLSQVLNTYWLTSIGYAPLQGHFQQDHHSSDAYENSYFNSLNGTGTRYNDVTVFVTSIPWVATLFVASGILLLSTSALAVLGMFRRTPDILDNFSSLIKDNRYVNLGSVALGSSALDGFDRSRQIGQLMVQIGDVQPHEADGYIAVSVPEAKIVGRIERRRNYL